MEIFRMLQTDDRGAGIVEYGLIVGVISLLSLTAVTLVGEETSETFTTVAEAIDEPSSGDGGPVESGASSDSDGASGDAGSGAPADDNSGSDQDDSAGGESNDDSNNQHDQLDNEDDEDDSENEEEDDSDDSDDGSAGDSQGGDSAEDDDEEVGEAAPGSQANPTAKASEFTWWNDTKHGGNGEWKASVTFENDWIRHQYLTLEVTTVDDKGKKSTTEVSNFYVPAGGSTTYSHWGNVLKDHKGNLTGVMEVEVKVTAVKTSDEAWNPTTYQTPDSVPQTVSAPSIP